MADVDRGATSSAFADLRTLSKDIYSTRSCDVNAVPSEQLYLLADASLLKLLDGRRFEMHPLVQRYALEKLQAQPEMLASAQQRFAHYYANLIESDGHELLRSTAKFQLLQAN